MSYSISYPGGGGGYTYESWTDSSSGYIGADAAWKPPAQINAETAGNAESATKSAFGEAIPIFRGSAKQVGRPIAASDVAHYQTREANFYYSVESVYSWPAEYASRGTIALCFGLNAFSKSMSLNLLKGGDKILFAAPGKGSPEVTCTVRWYDGINNDLDPFITSLFPAGKVPSHEGYLTVVVENLDLMPFGLAYPVFTAEWSDDSVSESSDTVLASPFDNTTGYPAVLVEDYCYDPVLNRIYQTWRTTGVSQVYTLGIVDLNGGAEVSRIAIANIPARMVALPGSDCVVGMNSTSFAVSTSVIVVNAVTGVQVAATATGEGYYVCSAAQYLTSGGSKYIATVQNAARTQWRLAVIDLVAGTIVMQNIGPAVTVYSFKLFASCVGNVATNYCQFFVSADASVYEIIYQNGAASIRLVKTLPSWNEFADNITGLAYDATDQSVIVSWAKTLLGPNYVAKVSPTGASVWQTEMVHPDSARVFDGSSRLATFTSDYELANFARMREGRVFAAGLSGGSLSPAQYAVINLTDGSRTGLPNQPVYFRLVYDDYSGNFYRFGQSTGTISDPAEVFWTRKTASTTLGDILISDILRDFCSYNDIIPAAQILFEGLGGLVCKGFNFSQNFQLLQVIRSICDVYNISFFESGDYVKFVRNPQDVSLVTDASINASTFIETRQGNASLAMSTQRGFDLEMAVKVEMQFIDPEREFNSGSATHERPRGVFDVSASSRSETLSLPLTIPALEAKRLAVERLYNITARRNGHRIELPAEWLLLEPGDLIDLATPDGNAIVIVEDVTIREDFSIEINVADYLDATVTAIAADSGLIKPPGSDVFGASRYIHLDLPLLKPSHDTAGSSLVQYHVLAGRGQEGWNGAMLYRGIDPLAIGQVDSRYGINPFVGIAINVIATPADPFSIDLSNTLRLTVAAGTSSAVLSATYDQVMNGSNRAAYGRPGRWEIISWENAVAQGDGSLSLSRLHRGFSGTEVFAASHAAGDLFVPLPESVVAKLTYKISDLNDVFYYKAYANNSYPIGVLELEKISGAAERCYAPVQLLATIDAGDIDLEWTRRTRLDGRWGNNGSIIPVGEVTESYDIEIMSGVTVVRTFTAVVTATKTYLAADIATDFGAMPATLTWRVYQNSGVTGRGYRAQTTSTL